MGAAGAGGGQPILSDHTARTNPLAVGARVGPDGSGREVTEQPSFKRPPWISAKGWEDVKEEARATDEPLQNVLRTLPAWMTPAEWNAFEREVRASRSPDGGRGIYKRGQQRIAKGVRKKLAALEQEGQSPGACRLCGAIRDGVKPEGKRWKCHNCGESHVAGVKAWERDGWVILASPVADPDWWFDSEQHERLRRVVEGVSVKVGGREVAASQSPPARKPVARWVRWAAGFLWLFVIGMLVSICAG